MLDSTGRRESMIVSCANCERPIYFMKYTPEYGHGGEELNVGSCITRDSAEIPKVVLHLIDIKDGEVVSSEFHLRRSDEPYHYNGFQIPNFGFYPGEVMCLCSKCYELTPSAVAIRRISHAIEEFVCRAVFSGDIKISFEKKSQEKKELLEKSKKLSAMLEKLSRMDARFGKNVVRKINKALRKLYPV